jgi:hypothetical protein
LEEANPAGAETAEPEETPTPPKKISLTDPTARWTAAPGGPAFFAYSTNYLIDLQAGIIVDVEATPANRSQEVESTRTMIDRIERRHDLKPYRLVGDTAYGTAAMLGWMVGREIAPHVKPRARTVHSPSTSSSGMKRRTNIVALLHTCYAVTGASSRTRAPTSRRLTRSSTGRANPTVRTAR